MTGMLSARIEVTSFHPGTSGGGVVVGREGGREVRALIRAAALPREPRAGESWRVTGSTVTVFLEDHRTGARAAVRQIAAEVAVPLEPSGAGIRRWIARNREIPGVGEAYADRLWDALGPRLYGHLRARDVTPIAKVLDLPKARAIVDAWALLTDEVTALEELDRLGVSGATANAALRLFGARAAERFATNPYLVSLLEPWRETDAAALAAGLAPDDRRRLDAAVDIAAARWFRTHEFHLGGHTAVTREMLRSPVRRMLGTNTGALADRAIDSALETGALRLTASGLMQARGPWHMEREIEEDLAARLALPRAAVPGRILEEVIAGIELEDGLVLEPEQGLAVAMALTSGVSSISGGAGTGKSMVCKAVLRAVQLLYPPRSRPRQGVAQAEVTCCMVAISGRAAKVLRDVTGGGAMTVHRFLAAREAGRLWFERGLLVVDEASMVGTPDLWRILSVTPRAAGVLLVGDVAQLPPVRAGFPARVLATAREVPRVTLTAVHRQAAATGIPVVSSEVREGRPPSLGTFDHGSPHGPGVRLLACHVRDVPLNVLRVFEAIAGVPVPYRDADALDRLHRRDVQILCMTNSGPAGAKEIGDAVERRWMAAWPTVHDWGLKVGSKILWTRNSYDRRSDAARQLDGDTEGSAIDVMNGSLGIVRRPGTGGKRTAMVSFDGADDVVEIDETDLERLVRGWAMTIHKAQGSSFRHVVLPLVPSRLLDRAMLYTALTRARVSAVLVGDPRLFAASVLAEPRAWHRLQSLDPDAAIRANRGRGTTGITP